MRTELKVEAIASVIFAYLAKTIWGIGFCLPYLIWQELPPDFYVCLFFLFLFLIVVFLFGLGVYLVWAAKNCAVRALELRKELKKE